MLNRLSVCLLLPALFATLATSLAIGAEPTVRKEDLPRVPATEAKDALKTFKVRPGFHLELAACEPNVVDPVAMCFDENGRMFVVEMIDYSERRNEKLGRIRMLEDIDGDGAYEKSTIFLEHLPWPTALIWVNGGLLVGACPDILFAKDTNGDGIADETKILFTGFGTDTKLNVQGLFNNFQWGMDNRIHGCSGHDGGMVSQTTAPSSTKPAAPPREPLDVRGKGFVINPRDWSMTTEAGGGQYGLSFDPSGRLFTCTNSSHCEVFMYDWRYAERNPYVTLPDPRISIAADGPAAEVFRISPEEPWRVIRTRWRIAGLVPGMIEGGGRSAGYFTGATGITIYRGDAFPSQYVGDAFIGDAGGNLVHHKRIRPGPDGIEPIAQRPEDGKKIEFVASTDNWFRPVDFANAPDGCLYICDMYRETIEHPWSIPPQIKQFLDLNSGNDRGRIYRIAPDGWKPDPHRTPHLSEASIADLVKLLEHPNGWHRESAARLLFERQDPAAIPLLQKLFDTSNLPLARMHALHALDGLGAADERRICKAIVDDNITLRTHAIALSESLLKDGTASKGLWAAYVWAADRDDPRTRYQLAFTIGLVKHPERAQLLQRLMRWRDPGKWMRVAILCAAGDDAPELLRNLLNDNDWKDNLPLMTQLAEMVGGQSGASVTSLVAQLQSAPDKANALMLELNLLRGAERGGKPLDAGALDAIIRQASSLAQDKIIPPKIRQTALAILGYATWDQSSPALIAALGERSESTQLAALSTLDRFDQPALADSILRSFSTLTPRAKTEAINVMLKRPSRALALLGTLKQSDLDASQVNQLLSSKDDAVRKLAASLLPPPATRSTVVESFRPALSLKGDSTKGKLIYEQRCISCHRAAGEGNAVGPDLITVKNAGAEKLLLNILDPSREVAANYINYLIETRDGQSVLGILASDTPSAITVRQAYAKETVIPREQIKRMSSQGKSLMPDGLETDLKPQDLADVISFIESAGK